MDCSGCTQTDPLGGTHYYGTKQHGLDPANQRAMTANPPHITEDPSTEDLEEEQPIISDTQDTTAYQEMPKADIPPTLEPLRQTEHPNLNAGNDTTGVFKFDTPEIRQQFLNAYLKHIAEGYSDDSFRFQGSGIKLFKTYVERFPEEFPSDILEDGQAERLKFWERMGMQGAMGIPVKYKDAKGVEHEAKGKFDGRTWQFNMQNRFKWKNQTDLTSDGEKLEAPVIYIPEEDTD